MSDILPIVLIFVIGGGLVIFERRVGRISGSNVPRFAVASIVFGTVVVVLFIERFLPEMSIAWHMLIGGTLAAALVGIVDLILSRKRT